MDRERVAVLGRPLVHVDDLHADPVLLQEQGRDETDRTGADDEDLRIGDDGTSSFLLARCGQNTREPQT